MAPGVSSGKRSAKVTHSRLYEGTSATYQVASMGADARPRAPQAWADPDIDYSKPWFEERLDAHGDRGFYCLLCSAWATDGHVSSDKHKSRADNPEWYGQYVRRGPDAQAFDDRFSRPWFESRDGEYYCRLCNAWATEGHVSSDRHKKREQYPEHYGFYMERPAGEGGACRGAAGGAAPSAQPARSGRGAAPQTEAYNELLREYHSKPWFELKDGEWYCNLCGAWATEGHLTGDKHLKRQMYPEWYSYDKVYATTPMLQDRPAAAQRSHSPLPVPWTRHWSADHNRNYFHNAETNTTTWEKPSFPAAQDEPPLPPPAPEPAPAPRAAERQEESPWQQFFCRTYNQHYYHNRMTGETTWTLPDALAPTQAEAAQQAPAEPPRAAGAAAASPQEPEWDRHWSEAHARYYYVSKVTGETTWTPGGLDDSVVDV